MRIFIGIEIPQNLKDKIKKNIRFLEKKYKSFRWINQENYHITLVFLGDINPQKLPKIRSRVQKASFNTTPFYLFSSSLSVFPNRTLILHVRFQREKKLENLVNNLQKELQDYLKNTPQREFVPHITISRAKKPSKQQYLVLKKLLEKTNIPFEFKVDHLYLYSSTLTPHGSIYKKLAKIRLNP